LCDYRAGRSATGAAARALKEPLAVENAVTPQLPRFLPAFAGLFPRLPALLARILKGAGDGRRGVLFRRNRVGL